MAGNTFGTVFKVTTFGESHGAAIGAVIDGCPAGIPLTVEDFMIDLNASKSTGAFETARREENKPEILSGIFEGKTLGTPIAVLIRNTDARPHDYERLKNIYRPGHADFAYEAKYHRRDWRGGGRASGRETAARIAAGTVAKKILARYTSGGRTIDIDVAATEIAGISCNIRHTSEDIPPAIREKLAAVKQAGDSIGAIVQCIVRNVPAGLGEPVFDKLEAELAKAILSIGSVKGIAFGTGFQLSRMTGSEANIIDKNHHGGIAGGISDGKNIVFSIVIKPVPSIMKAQIMETIDGKRTKYAVEGRHDICLYRKVMPIVEAMTAIVLADMLLRQRAIVDDTGFEPVTSTV